MTLIVWSTWLVADHARPASAAATVLIDFDDLPANAAGSPPNPSFTAAGVRFDGAAVLDFSQAGKPFDNFPRSPPQAAATICQVRSGACGFTMSFASGQVDVRLFAGFISAARISPPRGAVPGAPSSSGARTTVPPRVGIRRSLARPVAVASSGNVEVVAFDSAGRPITAVRAEVATDDPTPSIDQALEVRSSAGAIRTVQVGIVGAPTGALGVDDVEFERAEPATDPPTITTPRQETGGTALPPTGGGASGSGDPLRTVVIVVLAAAALAALGTGTYLWLRPSAPLHVLVLPAPTVQTFGADPPPTTVTVRFDPSDGPAEWTDRSRE